jgi:uncharacterized protein YjiS (DUF1127 family)
MRAAPSRPVESAKSQPLARKAWTTPRPGTALEELIERLMHAGVPGSVALPLTWLKRLRHRHELAALSEEQIRDVGLDPSLVRRESEKPFWQA